MSDLSTTRDESPPRAKPVATHCWADIAKDPRIYLIYPKGAKEANDEHSIPFAVRNRLGDFLLEATKVRTFDIVEKRALFNEINRMLCDSLEANLLWWEWCKLGFNEKVKKHTINSIYLTLWVLMEAERKYAARLIRK